MKKLIIILSVAFFLPLSLISQNDKPNFETIYKREIPAWFNQDKFGIFVVWGPYSVPSFKSKGYAEWYWKNFTERDEESKEFHKRVYGEDFIYEQFAEQFKAEMFDADFWCELFAKSGAKYVATTANYHDGFAMWPTEYSKTIHTDQWNSMVVGPKRDILGELNKAGEKHGLKMGIYYSLYEWYHPLWLNDKEKFVTDWLFPKFKEVVSKYKPWHIFLDGEWEQGFEEWKSEELAYWLYNESPVKNTVVVNDRWGKSRGIWGDIYESEYGDGKYSSPHHPWQEDRGIGTSYGYNRMESIYDYDSRDELLNTFSSVVGGGGNFLLCVGPTGDGRIPVIMQERLLQIGEWLKVNGEAVYGTTASPFWPRKFDWGTISAKPGKLFLHVHNPDLGKIDIQGFEAEISSAKLLHKKGSIPVAFKMVEDNVSLEWPSYFNDNAVTIIELNLEDDYKTDKTNRQFSNGNVEFNCWAMKVHGDKAHPHYDGYGNRLRMLDWTDPNEFLTADIVIEKPGVFDISLLYGATNGDAANEFLEAVQGTVGGKYIFKLDGESIPCEIQDTGNSNKPRPIEIGKIKIDKPGKYELSIKPVDDGNWNGFRFQGVEMTLLK